VIEIHDHLTGEVQIIRPKPGAEDAMGHGGGDAGLMAAFVQAVRDRTMAVTTARQALESHLMALAAGEARVTGTVMDMDRYRQQAQHAPSDGP
jgi:predicted flavoprotein YhiN